VRSVLAVIKPRTINVALAGNPNAGKTTLFNALTGAHQKVGNYPGVTVEKREGSRAFHGGEMRLVDLPGTYSLTAYSLDEVIARDFVLEEKPDVVVGVMDSTNLERHLYLCLQFQEIGIPVVGALNMSDEAEANGIFVDADKLSRLLGLPMVKTVGPKGAGMDELLAAVEKAALRSNQAARTTDYGSELESWLVRLQREIDSDPALSKRYPSRWLAVKLIEKDPLAAEKLKSHVRRPSVEALRDEAVKWIERHFAKDAEIVVSEQRYGYIHGACVEAVRVARTNFRSLTEHIDSLLMNPFLGLPIFLALLWGIFRMTFAVGQYPTAWLDSLFGWLAGAVGPLVPGDFARSLILDGIIGGVGSVLSFMPLIVILFFFLSLLEDTGYMSRAAFLTDRFLHAFGLHGQSFFPLMLGFGCSVPAIMAARTLKSPHDRIVTTLAVPFMSCGAKLPVYVLLAAAFFPRNPTGPVMGIYAIGITLALLSSLLLRKTVLRGEPTPFVMELPPYRVPTLHGVLWHVWEKTRQYVKKAGTVILAASVLIWVVTTLPRPPQDPAAREAETAAFRATHAGAAEGEVTAHIGTFEAQRRLSYSIAGRLGHFIEPAVRPLGFDWKIGVSAITGFAAKEVVVSTLGILYRVGTKEGEKSQGLRAALRADPTFSPLLAFVFMLFILIIPPCFAALATLRAELGLRWMGFAVVYLLALGWGIAFAVRSIGVLLGGGT
jgi:ferrous iron transport protein B